MGVCRRVRLGMGEIIEGELAFGWCLVRGKKEDDRDWGWTWIEIYY